MSNWEARLSRMGERLDGWAMTWVQHTVCRLRGHALGTLGWCDRCCWDPYPEGEGEPPDG